ncbi:TetR/AcrR family transcriptional regulator [Pannonibacter sp.]|uniref:TetR/AcrR family transcriptional regulator n=1 Tax=Pannonibacter sp. TaxID=1906786 RepID=UPI003F6FC560
MKPRKQPRQGRSRQTCDAILEASARILEEDGIARFTTNRIAERAGVSIGSLYQYYPSKEAILAALIRGLHEELLEDLGAAIKGATGRPFATAIEMLLKASLLHHARRPALAFTLERLEAGLPLDQETFELKQRIRVLVTGLLQRFGIDGVGQTAFDLIAIIHGLAQAATAAGETDMDALYLRLRRAAFGYLGMDWRSTPE